MCELNVVLIEKDQTYPEKNENTQRELKGKKLCSFKNQDFKQKVKIIPIILYELYKVIISSFLILCIQTINLSLFQR